MIRKKLFGAIFLALASYLNVLFAILAPMSVINEDANHVSLFAGNGNKDGLFTVLLRDYGNEAAAVCMNRLAKLR